VTHPLPELRYHLWPTPFSFSDFLSREKANRVAKYQKIMLYSAHDFLVFGVFFKTNGTDRYTFTGCITLPVKHPICAFRQCSAFSHPLKNPPNTVLL
jgi:hypothetical protein